jgi:hypothetical protein
MSLTITEANAVNRLLDFVLQLKGVNGHVPTSEEARNAAEVLARGAKRSLSAGLDAADVEKYWPIEGCARCGRKFVSTSQFRREPDDSAVCKAHSACGKDAADAERLDFFEQYWRDHEEPPVAFQEEEDDGALYEGGTFYPNTSCTIDPDVSLRQAIDLMRSRRNGGDQS